MKKLSALSHHSSAPAEYILHPLNGIVILCMEPKIAYTEISEPCHNGFSIVPYYDAADETAGEIHFPESLNYFDNAIKEKTPPFVSFSCCCNWHCTVTSFEYYFYTSPIVVDVYSHYNISA